MEEDDELKLITHRKLAQLKKRVEAAAATKTDKVEKTDREVVLGMLFDRGDEVLETAYSYFPKQTDQIVKELARLIRTGRFNDKISGGELFSLFRTLGVRFNLKTSIKVQEKGRLIDIGEKFKLGGE